MVWDAVNEDIFNNFFMNQLLGHIQAYPGAHSLIMIDNIPFHHNLELQELVEATGAILLYLPAYKPDWNLAEYHFQAIKRKEERAGVCGDDDAAFLSLCQSVKDIEGVCWDSVLKEIGYID